MFSYIRIFSAISSLLIILAAIAVGMYFRSIAEQDLQMLVEKNNRALAQGFINSTWKHHRPVLLQLMKMDVAQWRRYQQFDDFEKDVFRYFDEMPVSTVNLYTRSGSFILSTDAIKKKSSKGYFTASDDEEAQREAFQKAMRGNVSNRIIPEIAFPGPDGNLIRGTLVQSLIPIFSDAYVPVVDGSEQTKQNNIEGILEVFYDVTPQWKQLTMFQMIGTGGIVAIFLILIVVLIITSKKAESIIAKQHEANLELASAAARAEAENRNKSQFLANVSHELRTPLNAIIGFSEIIKNELMGTIENTQYHDYIRDIHSSGVHLLSLINDILDYSKAEAGKLELELAEVDVTKTVLNSMRLVSPRAEAAEVILVEEIPKEHFVLTTDAKKLKQVMLNLLSNAVKFTPAGGEVKVTMWQNVVDKSLCIEVKDTGIGIAPKDISRAMAPFGQVDNALSRKYEGTGLGLPLTKKFVELIGGTFNILSEVNAGTTITITLPAVPPQK